MPNAIFISLPVADVARSAAFYRAIGFVPDDRFPAGHAAAMAWSDTITLMLLDKGFFGQLTPKTIVDPRTHTGALFALPFDTRAGVDAITVAAVAAGGREAHGPEEDGGMYSRAFEDPDGHGFGPFCMGGADGAG